MLSAKLPGVFIAVTVLLISGYIMGHMAKASGSAALQAYAKPHAAVDIQYKVTNPSASGFPDEPLAVKVSLVNKLDVDDLMLKVRLGSGLYSTQLQAQYNFGVMPKNQLSEINFDVAASSAGRYRLYIVASLVNSGKSQGRNVIMPLTIGDVAASANKPVSNVIIDSTGTAIISMPGKAVN